jgi:hypothetical protein
LRPKGIAGGIRHFRAHIIGDKMKILIAILALAVLILPALGLTDSQKNYFAGIDKGYQLGVLYVQAQGSAQRAHEYNDLVQRYNNALNMSLGPQDAAQELLAYIPIPDACPACPAFLKADPEADPWKGTSVGGA